MAVNGRKKGQTAERKLAKLFSVWWGSDFARTPLSGGFATAKFREDWNAAGDLVTPDETFPFCVESKKVEGWTLEQMLTSDRTHIHKWWQQTLSETPVNKIPLLVFTKNRAPLYVMMCVSDIPAALYDSLDPHFRTTLKTIDTRELIIFALPLLLATSKDVWLHKDYL